MFSVGVRISVYDFLLLYPCVCISHSPVSPVSLYSYTPVLLYPCTAIPLYSYTPIPLYTQTHTFTHQLIGSYDPNITDATSAATNTVYTHTPTHKHNYTHPHTHTHKTHTYTHTHKHTHTYTHTPVHRYDPNIADATAPAAYIYTNVHTCTYKNI